MRANRVWLAIGVVLMASAFYEGRLKPQSRPAYERALSLYRQANYEQSLLELNNAYAIEPNSTAILVLMGWNELKLGQHDQARENFSRASRLDPQLVEAKLGLAYLEIHRGGSQVRLDEIEALLAQDPGNQDFQLAASSILRRIGRNRDAAELFRGMLGRGSYGEVARQNLEQMYGLQNVDADIPASFPELNRPADLQVNFRAGEKFLQRRNGNAWQDVYVRGVNIGPATPGSFATEPPDLVEVYLPWLDQIAGLGANTVRVYTILPPAFYRALQMHNQKPDAQRLYLIQEVWLADAPDAANLYLPGIVAESRQEIAQAIDVIHGQGDLPIRPGKASGLYVVDVSEYVLALLVGREFEPPLVWTTNEANPGKTSYSGRYVSIPQGNPTEVWLAEMLDFAANHEVVKYNAQRPIAIVNWPPLDPLSHPTEAGIEQIVRIRERSGETGLPVPSPGMGDDQVSVDDTRLRAESLFQGGIFASYHVYPYYPNFLLNEPALLRVQDQAGPNSYFGYLQALKAHYRSMPLLIAEYGLPTSIGVSRFHPYGWNHGGITERQQGELLARMTQNIFDVGAAGGMVFEWQDEWWKLNWLTVDFEVPADRRPLWHNRLNPEQHYGLWAYDPSRSRLFSPDTAAWDSVRPLYQKPDSAPAVPGSDGADLQRTLRSLAVSSDEEFLYLRLRVGSLPRAADGSPDLRRANFLIGIGTSPGRFGSQVLPGISPLLRYSGGVNFLLHVGGVGSTRLLVSSSYSPYALWPATPTGTRMDLGVRAPWAPILEEWSPFEEMVVETSMLRYGRDGTAFPPQRYSRSPLRYGPLDRNHPQYDSLATWSADFSSNSLIFRIPWGLLFVTDPSSRLVYTETRPGAQIHSETTSGIALFAVSFVPPASAPDWARFPALPMAATDSLPPTDGQGNLTDVRSFIWEGWNSVTPSGRLKSGADLLRQSFLDLQGKGY